MKSMKGIFPALLTPFTAEGRVDERALRQLVSAGIGRGVTGFYVCGSTAESFLLSLDERKRILEVVASETAGRAVIICHVGAIGTDLSVDLGKHAVASGADSISSIPPFYYKFSDDEIVGYYSDLVERVGAPLIPYNFPLLSGVTLSGDLLKRLRVDPRVIGVKFTSNDLYQLERMKKNDPGLIVYSGFDEIFLGALSMGAEAAIGSTFNFMPEKFIGIRKYFEQGNFEAARKLQEEANSVVEALMGTGKLLNAHKYILELQGIPFGECRRPFLPLTGDDKVKLEAAARRYLKL
jgi:N-acetylneuraminate lyase